MSSPQPALRMSNLAQIRKHVHRKWLDIPYGQRQGIYILLTAGLLIMLMALKLHNKTLPDDLSSLEPLHPPQLLVAIMSAPWDLARRAMAERTCSEFKSENIDCRLFDAIDIRSNSVSKLEDSADIQHLIEAKGVLNRQYVEEHWDGGRGKIGHSVTFLMMMDWIRSIFEEEKAFDFVLYLEDDAVIPDIHRFSGQLIGDYLSMVHHHRIFEDLDAIHLSQSGCDNPWFRYMAFTNPNGNDIGLWENRSGAVSRFWSGTVGNVYSRKWIEQTMDQCLDRQPMDYYTDIWLSRFIVDGTVKMYTICPNTVGHADEDVIGSVVHGPTSLEKSMANSKHSHPYFWAMAWDTVICVLYTVMAIGMVIGGIGCVYRLLFKWLSRMK